MSVAEQLGLADQSGDLLVVAGQRWEFWATGQPALTRCGGLSGLRSRLRAGDPAGADEVLHALATLGAVDGGDDVAAAAVLAWALLPGACTLAHRLASLTPQIDEVVAAALWVEVRTFPWRRCRKVAANVLLNTRVGVLRDCGAASQLQRTDRTWSRTRPVDPSGAFWGSWASTQSEHPPSPAAELLELLEWGRARQVITGDEAALLMSLVEAADRAPTNRVRRGTGGLMANDICAAVAARWGIAPTTVRRRARASIDALARARTSRPTRIPA